MAMSGSTNAVMHLTAIAHEAELKIDVLSEFDKLSRTTPQVAKMNPACNFNVIDFFHDGGVMRMMENLTREHLDYDQMTVTGHTIGENIAAHKYLYPNTGRTIRTPPTPALPSPAHLTRACTTLKARRFALTARKMPRKRSWPVRSTMVM